MVYFFCMAAIVSTDSRHGLAIEVCYSNQPIRVSYRPTFDKTFVHKQQDGVLWLFRWVYIV